MADQALNILCNMLDGRGWKYDRNDERNMVRLSFQGDDIPFHIFLTINPELGLATARSPMPFNFPEDKRVEGAVAACLVSYGFADGSFDFDLSDGEVAFRAAACYDGGTPAEELFAYLVDLTCAMVEKYNDQFFALSKGLIELDAFMK